MNTSHPDSEDIRSNPWIRRLLIILLLLPLLLLVFTPLGRSWSITPVLLLLFVVINFFLLIWLFRRASAIARAELPRPRMILPEEQPEVIKEVMDVCIATEEDGIRQFRGPLRAPPTEVYRRLKAGCDLGTIPLLQEDPKIDHAILLVNRPVEQMTTIPQTRLGLHWFLFFVTLLTTTWAGAAYQGVNLLQQPERFLVGLPYAIGLLSILGCHELGHYFAARHHSMNVTPPFFIPVPFALGTFGAFIRMRTPPEERTSLFDMALAGPLAGLVIAVPALLIGLRSSQGVIAPFGEERFLFSGFAENSLLFGLITRVQLSPLAFAGWLGLLVTVLNMLPVGQLDGGHIMRAMFGTRTGRGISTVAMWAIFLLAITVLPWLLLWVLIIFFIARHVTPPLNDLTPIAPWRRVLGLCSFGLISLLFIPLPEAFWARLLEWYPHL